MVTMVVVNSRRVVDNRSEVLVIGAVLTEDGAVVVLEAFAVVRAVEVAPLSLLLSPLVGVGVGVFAGGLDVGAWDAGGLLSDGSD